MSGPDAPTNLRITANGRSIRWTSSAQLHIVEGYNTNGTLIKSVSTSSSNGDGFIVEESFGQGEYIIYVRGVNDYIGPPSSGLSFTVTPTTSFENIINTDISYNSISNKLSWKRCNDNIYRVIDLNSKLFFNVATNEIDMKNFGEGTFNLIVQSRKGMFPALFSDPTSNNKLITINNNTPKQITTTYTAPVLYITSEYTTFRITDTLSGKSLEFNSDNINVLDNFGQGAFNFVIQGKVGNAYIYHNNKIQIAINLSFTRPSMSNFDPATKRITWTS